jgi:hypothetical protein
MIRENLKGAQSRQKSYADKMRDLSFEVGDFIYLNVFPMRGTHRFKVNRKLAPRYVGPFKKVDRKGEVAYQLELPPQLSDVHDVFHVSQLKKCLWILEEQLSMEELDLGGVLTYSEKPIKILDTAERVTRNKVIKMCQFNGVTIPKMNLPGSTKKSSKQIILNYSWALLESRGWDSSKGGTFVTLTFYKNKIFANI